MLSWLSETTFKLLSWIPNWLYADDTPRYFLVRGFLGLGLIVAIILIVALRPDRMLRENYRRRRNAGKEPAP